MRKVIIILTISQLIFSCSTVSSTSKFSSNSKEKKSVSIFPEGKESIKLLSATISTDTITTKGSKVTLNYQNIDSIITDNLIPVVVFVSNSVTIKTISLLGTVFSSGQFQTFVSNPFNGEETHLDRDTVADKKSSHAAYTSEQEHTAVKSPNEAKRIEYERKAEYCKQMVPYCREKSEGYQ
ncbi:MAG: hypothetical protein PF486_04705 [Prolixibacteraceae bacterium]|jgi:hypothetical protein|nr:hypothetical protein [Prolixibacteraceae bacterium]